MLCFSISAFAPSSSSWPLKPLPSISFTQGASPTTNRRLDGVGALVLAAMMALLAWRTGAGAMDAYTTRETSMLMELPTWIGYALMVPSFALASLAAIYVASRHFRLLDI